MALVSQREFARIRGWNPGYVAKLKARGVLVMVTESGRELVDVDASNAAIEASKDPAKGYMSEVNAAQRERFNKPPPEDLAVPAGASAAPLAGGTPVPNQAGSLFQKARAQGAAYDAKLKELEYLKASGKLVDKDDVRRAAASLAEIVVKGLEAIPARVGPLIAAERDPVKREQILEQELRKVRAEFADAAAALFAAQPAAS